MQETREKVDPVVREDLLANLPDKPRHVMARGLLLSGRGRVLIGPEGRRGAGYFVLDDDRPEVCQAIGRPVGGLVEQLLGDCASCHEVLCPAENGEHFASLLPGWVARPATAHVHPDPEQLTRTGDHEARMLTPEEAAGDDALAHLPGRLRREMELALTHAPVAATFVDGRPVAFCYAAYETESWWDVSVDTLPDLRRRGLATAAAGFLVERMLARGKRPVWGALDANQASRAMAAKYGFRAIERLMVFTPPERRASERS